MSDVKTVVTEQEEKTTLVLPSGLSGGYLQFGILGQTVERSYEDRSVYLEISNPELPDDILVHGWLNGEDAVRLGQAFIAQGLFALEACRINHQLIHEQNRLMKWISEGKVASLNFEVIDNKPANFGDGFRTFKITPVWKGEAAEFYSTFSLETVIYWSPFEDDFRKQIKYWQVPIKFVGYDHDTEVKKWRTQIQEEMAQPGCPEEVK